MSRVSGLTEVELSSLQLMALAELAREFSYAPYSQYTVGAALITKSGKVFLGCNVENASYGLTVCGERVAVFKAISEGEHEFEAPWPLLTRLSGEMALAERVVRC